MSEIETKAADFVTALLSENLTADYSFHNIKHTKRVVNTVIEIGKQCGLSKADLQVITLAAWFHDTGFVRTYAGHEEVSGEIADTFLTENKYPKAKRDKVLTCIAVTHLSEKPKDLLQQIIRDADLIHLGKKSFYKRNRELRDELAAVQNKIFSDQAWLEMDKDFLENNTYFTEYAQQTYGPRKAEHLSQISKQIEKNNVTGVVEQPLEAMTKSEKKERMPDRGIETMFRLASKNHFTLSSMADGKASTLISISALIISIIISILIRRIHDQPELAIPTVIMLLTLLGTIIFAVLSTRPKITSLNMTRDDVVQKKGNLLFFGNFINMSVEDYEWSIQELMHDREYLYANLTRDIYYLGIVLGKKYRYLRLAYNIFMYGLIVSVIAFISVSAF